MSWVLITLLVAALILLLLSLVGFLAWVFVSPDPLAKAADGVHIRTTNTTNSTAATAAHPKSGTGWPGDNRLVQTLFIDGNPVATRTQQLSKPKKSDIMTDRPPDVAKRLAGPIRIRTHNNAIGTGHLTALAGELGRSIAPPMFIEDDGPSLAERRLNHINHRRVTHLNQPPLDPATFQQPMPRFTTIKANVSLHQPNTPIQLRAPEPLVLAEHSVVDVRYEPLVTTTAFTPVVLAPIVEEPITTTQSTPQPKVEVEAQPETELQAQHETETELQAQSEAKASEAKASEAKASEADSEAHLENELQAQPEAETELQAQSEAKASEAESEAHLENELQAQPEAEPHPQAALHPQPAAETASIRLMLPEGMLAGTPESRISCGDKLLHIPIVLRWSSSSQSDVRLRLRLGQTVESNASSTLWTSNNLPSDAFEKEFYVVEPDLSTVDMASILSAPLMLDLVRDDTTVLSSLPFETDCPSCAPGQINCGGHCHDRLTDSQNCNGCGISCPIGFQCQFGVCVPSSPASTTTHS
jgi:hypothetical protein